MWWMILLTVWLAVQWPLAVVVGRTIADRPCRREWPGWDHPCGVSLVEGQGAEVSGQAPPYVPSRGRGARTGRSLGLCSVK